MNYIHCSICDASPNSGQTLFPQGCVAWRLGVQAARCAFTFAMVSDNGRVGRWGRLTADMGSSSTTGFTQPT